MVSHLGKNTIIINLSIYFLPIYTAKPPPPRYSLESTTPTSITIHIKRSFVSGVKAYKIQYQEIGAKKLHVAIGPVAEHTINGEKRSNTRMF